MSTHFSAPLFRPLALLVLTTVCSRLGAAEVPGAACIDGPATCSTSGCHGGASESSRQYAIWSQRDVHSRSFATLTSARSARMAEALRIPDPAKSNRCTTCHAPLANVAPELLAANAHVEDGVTCVSCHGPATDEWIRAHTRKDWSHADRVAAGTRELRNLYGRANACVACHQNIDPEIVRVGVHPQLIFELDGQTASEPSHWREREGWHGAKAWYVGQAVALRELSSALAHGRTDAGLDGARWSALVWLLGQCATDSSPSPFRQLSSDQTPAAYAAALETADTAARQAADSNWSAESSRTLLRQLAATQAAFRETSVSTPVQARRAERLVLALDRLIASLPATERPKAGGEALDRLFQLAQSVPDFEPAKFADALGRFGQAL
ncbi:MAG: hypothetical protein JSR48_13885 [Verrucomicrobia bacterium]|nr:hypothetical protein [Verrucomicrobiota bacterium]